MDTTVSLEFLSETKEHLKTLEHQLKHEHGVSVDMIEPRDLNVPALITIGIKGSGERSSDATRRVAQVLYHFLHGESTRQKHIFLLTIEGERVDIGPLSAEEIEEIILEAVEGAKDF